VQHHLLLLNSRLIRISWETVWSFQSHYTSGEKLVWTLVVTVQFVGLWIVVIQDPRTVRFHFPR
jgi:hypothetical protein